MGGIPTNNDCQVHIDETDALVTGFFAAGECGCSSVHGANRLGTNSLLEALVFGRRAGKSMLDVVPGLKLEPVNEQREIEAVQRDIEEVYAGDGTENLADIKEDLKQTMTVKVGVYRDAADMVPAQQTIAQLRQRFAKTKVKDGGKQFNLNLLEALALGNMLEFSELIVDGGLAREESRGAHFRNDFPTRDDVNWLKHTMAFRTEDGGHELRYKPVRITRFQPEERKY
jgi:succinate dehydrogenase / fumarate reductase flavoprotein subunit